MESFQSYEPAIRSALVSMGIAAPGEPVELTPLVGGVSSLVVVAETAERGKVCVKLALPELRTAVCWQAPRERSAAEVAWLRFARRHLPEAVPAVIAEDPSCFTFAMEYLPSNELPVWKTELAAGKVDLDFARKLGRCLGTLHAASARDADIGATFANADSFHALRLDPYFYATARAHPHLSGAIVRLAAALADRKQVLIHGDVSPKNILVGRSGPVLLDAECATYSDPAFDLAFVLHHLLLKRFWLPTHDRKLLACFFALSGDYLKCIDWEPAEAVEARAAAIIPALLLARIDGKSPVEYLANDDRDRVRRFAMRFVENPNTRLEAIANAREWAL